MKTTEFKEIIEFLKNELKLEISSAQEKMLFDKFIATKDVTNLVLWCDRFIDVTNLVLWRCVCVENERHQDPYERQGVITKEEYENIKMANIKPNEVVYFDEDMYIAQYTGLYCYFKDISFTEDSSKILDFYNENEDDYPLLDYLYFYNQNEEKRINSIFCRCR